METVSFDALAQGWNQIRMSGAPNLKAAVSGLTDPSRILLQRVGESPTSLTLMFKGFDQALENPSRDGPVLKRALFAWIRKYAEAQIVRGDPTTFTVMIRKPPQEAQPQIPPQQPVQPPMQESRGLVHISNVRKVK